jgi:hypothetical protein
MPCIVVSIGCVAVGFRMIQIAMKSREPRFPYDPSLIKYGIIRERRVPLR